MPKTSTSFEDGNQAALKHGAFAYAARVADGRPLSAHMKDAETSVIAEYRAAGPRGMMEAAALEFETMARLHKDAMLTSVEAYAALETRWAYLKAKAAGLWRDLAAMPAPDDDHGDVLAAYRTVSDDNASE